MTPATSTMPSLTKRQKEIYDFIADRIRACGYPPTIREIGAHLGIRSTNGVADHLKALKRKGYLSQAASKSRTWQPLKPSQGSPSQNIAHTSEDPSEAQHEGAEGVVVPILGKVAAGKPILAEERADDMLRIDPALLPRGRDVFALRVSGDSMIEAGILNGDIVFVERRQDADAGSIVVALIDDEATVKRYYRDGDSILLRPANAAMQTLVVHASEGKRVQILGAVVGVFRRF